MGFTEKSMTLKDIAKLSGVSYRVVAEVMNGSDGKGKIRFGEATREKVLATASEYNYRPNRAARNLKSQRQNAIGVYTGHSIYNVHDRALNQLLHCCRKEGIFPVIETTSPKDSIKPVSLVESAIDGALLFADIPGIEEDIQRTGIPVVHVNSNHRTEANCVTYDEDGGVRICLEYFRQTGCCCTGLIMSRSTHYSADARESALLQQQGDDSSVLKLGDEIREPEGRRQAIARMVDWLGENPELDSVLLSADLFAPLFYQAARIAGRRIPEDVAVIGYNNSSHSEFVQPELTTVAVDYPGLSRTAFSLLMDMINGTEACGPILLPYELKVRQSTK